LQIGWRRRGTDALRRLGYEIDVVVDGEAWDWFDCSTSAQEGVRQLQVENYDWSEHLAFLLARLTAAGQCYDAVVGFDEFSLIPAWQAATMLGLPGLDWRVVSNMRDKSAQKAILRCGGVPCARSWLVNDIRAQQADVARLSPHLPLVLKPYSGASTVNTFLARTTAELDSVVGRLSGTAARMIQVEEYVSGVEHHADGVVREGEVMTLALNEYLGIRTLSSTSDEPGRSQAPAGDAVLGSLALSPWDDPAGYEQARHLVTTSLKLLGHHNGVFHVELFRTGQGWVLSEAAMRVGGGGVPLHNEHTRGVDLHEAMARAQLGQPAPPEASAVEGMPLVTGWTYLPGLPGIVRGLPGPEEVLRMPGVLAVEFTIRPGQAFDRTVSNAAPQAGVAVLGAQSRAELVDRRVDLIEWFRSRIDVNDRA
jgi:biotin carboxylase